MSTKPIVMTPSQWTNVLEMIKRREKPSVYLSRTKMKEVLGCTVREHNEWVKDPKAYTEELTPFSLMIDFDNEGWYKGKRQEHTVRLDFYDEQKRTMFLLKYGNGKN